MNSSEQSARSEQVGSEQQWFSCSELSAIKLPGAALTDRGWRKVVEREGWQFREVHAKGGKAGVKREYVPPPELLKLIRRHMRGEVVTEEEVNRARAIRSVAFRKAPAGLTDYQQAPGRGQRVGAASVIDADEPHSASAAPSPSGVAGPAAAGAPTVAATATPAPGAHADTGRLTDPTDEDRLQMLLALLRTMERLHTARGLDFELARQAEDVAFRGEEQDLYELLGNLLDNAGKWARSRVLVDVQREGALLCFTVDDDGPGIPEAERARMFERGVQLDQRHPGSGLGLDIVRTLAETYGGSVEALESPLGGLRMRLCLPTGGQERV